MFREDFSFTAFATISYLKIGPKAGLLRNEAHIITIQGTTNKKSIHRNKPSESSNSEGSTENAQTVSKPTPDSAVKKSQDRKRHNCGTNFKAKKPKLQAGGDDQPVVLD